MSNDPKKRVGKSKFQEVFEVFSALPPQSEISEEIRRLINMHYSSLENKKSINLIHSCLDLTSLNATDNEENIFFFTKRVNDLDENDPTVLPVASICVYPNLVKTVKEHLSAEDVKITAVAGGFPSSQTFIEVKVAEVLLAIQDGADEIDIVLQLGDFLSGDYSSVTEEIEEIKEACHDKVLKVILETGALEKLENIQRASIISLFSGADFIKTSTGKEYPGASLEAVYVMATVLKEYYDKYQVRKGLKVSGGVRTTEEALQYLSIVKGVLGDEWLTPELFRIGASSLEKDLLKHLQ